MGRAMLWGAVLAVTVACAFGYTPIKWTNLYVKWNMFSYLARVTGHGYFKMPLSTEEARAADWTQAATDNFTSTWCLMGDPRVCVLYDQQGTVAGMQVSLPLLDVLGRGIPYDLAAHPFFFRDNLFGSEVVAVRFLLVPQEMLAGGGRARGPEDEVGSGLWLRRGAEYVHVPRSADELPAYWTREKCVFNMGRHYYHNVSAAMRCEDAEPFFLLVNNKKDALHGVGVQTFGNASSMERHWFESVPSSAVKQTLPNAPPCLEQWVAEYGLISLHIYFVERPWFIIC